MVHYYTYTSVDLRAANSMFTNVLMNAGAHHGSLECIAEETWVVGNALLTSPGLDGSKSSRVVHRDSHASARIENVSMVGLGEVDPDTLSVPPVLSMNPKFSRRRMSYTRCVSSLSRSPAGLCQHPSANVPLFNPTY